MRPFRPGDFFDNLLLYADLNSLIELNIHITYNLFFSWKCIWLFNNQIYCHKDFQDLFFSFFKCFILFLRERQREREREHEMGRHRQREADIESKAGSRLWPDSTEPNAGLKPTNHEIMTWAEVGHLAYWATWVPLNISSYCDFQYL